MTYGTCSGLLSTEMNFVALTRAQAAPLPSRKPPTLRTPPPAQHWLREQPLGWKPFSLCVLSTVGAVWLGPNAW